MSHGSSTAAINAASSKTAPRELKPGGWLPSTKKHLEVLIERHAHQGKIVVLDFDNTIVCRDAGESTFGALAEKVKTSACAQQLSPPFFVRSKRYSVEDNPIAYYGALQKATAHQAGGSVGYFVAYPWSVQVMAGLTAAQVVEATEYAWMQEASEELPFRKPFLYPEMVDLIGVLICNGFLVHIVSAANIWTVRWVVEKVLNPLLRDQFGDDVFIGPDHMIGIALLMQHAETNYLYNDTLLVRTLAAETHAYAALDPDVLGRYTLTSQMVFPISAYAGKAANIVQYITKDPPFLVAGDSMNDFEMMRSAEHRLWIARLEEPELQYSVANRIDDREAGTWLVQPTLTGDNPGFIDAMDTLHQRLPEDKLTCHRIKTSFSPWLALRVMKEFSML